MMCNVFSITCCIDMDRFSDTSKAVILVAFYIVLCFQSKTFVDRVQKYFGSCNCCAKSTKNLAALLRFFKCQVHFITIFLVFLSTEYLCFSFFNVLHPILYENSSSVSAIFLPGHVNRHSKQLIYETNIFNIFNNFKKFLTIFNSFVNYYFVFSPSFEFYATCDDNLVIPELTI